MATPVWRTPRTVYNLTDGVTKDDFERIGTNVLYLYTTTGPFTTAKVVNNAYSCTVPDITGLMDRLMIRILVPETNTAKATLNINQTGDIPIVQKDGSPSAAGDLVKGQIAVLLYYQNQFRLLETVKTTVTYGEATSDGQKFVAKVNHVSVLQPGTKVTIKFDKTNIGDSTLDINSLGAKPIRVRTTEQLKAGDIRAGQISDLIWDGTVWQLQTGGQMAPPMDVPHPNSILYHADSVQEIEQDIYRLVIPDLLKYTEEALQGIAIAFKIPKANKGPVKLSINDSGDKYPLRIDNTVLAADVLKPRHLIVQFFDGVFYIMSNLAAVSSVNGLSGEVMLDATRIPMSNDIEATTVAYNIEKIFKMNPMGMSTTPYSGDLNNLNTPGFYSAVDSANSPEAGYNYWMVQVTNTTTYKGDYVQQIAINERLSQYGMFIRSKDKITGWTPWVKIYTGHNIKYGTSEPEASAAEGDLYFQYEV